MKNIQNDLNQKEFLESVFEVVQKKINEDKNSNSNDANSNLGSQTDRDKSNENQNKNQKSKNVSSFVKLMEGSSLLANPEIL